MIIRQVSFPKSQYYQEATEKQQIILHHTVSSNEASPVDWWKITPERVATAYIIAKDGTIIQVYDPSCWAYHIGKGSTSVHNKRSIGIEIVNEGALVKKAGEMFWLDGKAKFKGTVYDNKTPYRGHQYFAGYTTEQYTAAAGLCKMLCKEFDIYSDILTDLDYSLDYFRFNGILSHRNLRPDKTDVSPAFDFELFKRVFNEEHFF
jgi:N-acetyl-anhydromuramyl-L-alanine amidase AmpD